MTLHRAAFGEGSGPIHMNYLECYGFEYKLVDCHYSTSMLTYQHYGDWSVTCNNGNHTLCTCIYKYTLELSMFTHVHFPFFDQAIYKSITVDAVTQH